MRESAHSGNGAFRAKAIAGTHTVLLALDCEPQRCKGLLGFAFKRQVAGKGEPRYLRSQKVFRSVVPDPKAAREAKPPRAFYTDAFPVQSFLWGDYAAQPGTRYRFVIQPMYGKPGALTTDAEDEIALDIATEEEWPDGATHGVWFNRGAIAGQKFAEEFGNHPPENIDDPKDPEVRWLSRGLLEACLSYINETRQGDALRVAAYEFTYPPVLNALKALLDKGVDVKIAYHDTTADGKDGPNEAAMRAAGLPVDDRKTTFRRSKTKIPHNKFIVRLKGGKTPVEVWTGSTNFTPSGFLGQTNVGHRVRDAATAKDYLAFWELVKTDPELADARAELATLTPNPAEAIAGDSIVRLFSPRMKSEMLGWYGRRMLNAANSVWFTAAFGIGKELVQPIAQKRGLMRFVLMEKPCSPAQKKELCADFNRVILSYGTPLGEIYAEKDGKITTRRQVKEFALDKWFFAEEHFRPANDGFVFFVHTKFLLIDPLSDDPLVCSGSANFSSGSLLQNDENMLLIRGDKRVADIYMTEFDRIFRHFYFRDIAGELAVKGSDGAQAAFLCEDDAWTASYFKTGTLKNNRRIMFFETPKTTWSRNAGAEEPAEKPAPDKKAPVKKKAARRTAEKPAAEAAKKVVKTAVKKTEKAAKKAAKKTPAKKTPRKAAAKPTKKATANKTKKAAKKTSAKKARKAASKKTARKTARKKSPRKAAR